MSLGVQRKQPTSRQASVLGSGLSVAPQLGRPASSDGPTGSWDAHALSKRSARSDLHVHVAGCGTTARAPTLELWHSEHPGGRWIPQRTGAGPMRTPITSQPKPAHHQCRRAGGGG
eukprot:scaffold14297_cov63-Phaeocystis_antarctica.AAC.1